jgi:hypothetical protein
MLRSLRSRARRELSGRGQEVFYVDFFRALHEEGVRYVLVGGIAVNLHGVERATADVDLLLGLDAPNLGRFRRVAARFGLRPVVGVTFDDFADAAKVQTWIREKGMIAFALRGPTAADPTVDILVQPVVSVEDALTRSVRRDLGGFPVIFAAIEDLVRMKSGTGRMRDAADVAALERVRALGLGAPDDDGTG